MDISKDQRTRPRLASVGQMAELPDYRGALRPPPGNLRARDRRLPGGSPLQHTTRPKVPTMRVTAKTKSGNKPLISIAASEVQPFEGLDSTLGAAKRYHACGFSPVPLPPLRNGVRPYVSAHWSESPLHSPLQTPV